MVYRCSVCDTAYEYQQDKKTCESSHNSSVLDHVDSNELRRLKGMSKALRANDYDKNNTNSDKSNQHDLRNRKVRRKNLKDFT